MSTENSRREPNTLRTAIIVFVVLEAIGIAFLIHSLVRQ
jgi:hypothetical protein